MLASQGRSQTSRRSSHDQKSTRDTATLNNKTAPRRHSMQVPALSTASEYVPVSDFKTVHAQGKSRMEVNKLMTQERRLRDGCKNMLKALPKTIQNAQHRSELKSQLSSIQSNITTLHAQLQKINLKTALECRQESLNGDELPNPFPLIALATKETAHADNFAENLGSFIETHYHEKQSKFDPEIKTLCASRELMRNASPTIEGKDWILQYFWQLQQAEHRFFQEDKCASTVFEWYDAFEGHPIIKKSLKLEKASVLYNLAAMLTQLGCKADRNTTEGLNEAIGFFEQAAGTLQYIREESSLKTSVSTDLSRSSLSTLSTLMLAQTQECIWYAAYKKGKDEDPAWQPSGAEAAAVSEWYTSARESLRQPLSSSMPKLWVDMICIKELYYRGIADWYTGIAEMAAEGNMKKVAGIAKVHRASLTLKRALGQWRAMCKADIEFGDLMQDHLSLATQVLEHVDDSVIENITQKADRVPIVTGKALQWAAANCECLINTSTDDLFARLGPVYFFNSMCALVERRKHTISFTEGQDAFGFSLSGGNPVRVSDVTFDSSAGRAGLRAGDYIIEIADIDVRGMVASEVTEVLEQRSMAGETVSVTVVVNYDMQNFEELINPEVPKSVPSQASAITMPGRWHTMGASSGVNLAGKRPWGVEVCDC